MQPLSAAVPEVRVRKLEDWMETFNRPDMRDRVPAIRDIYTPELDAFRLWLMDELELWLRADDVADMIRYFHGRDGKVIDFKRAVRKVA